MWRRFLRKKSKFLYRMKNATPDDAATSLESCFAELRPQAICLDKSVQTLSDPDTLRTQVFLVMQTCTCKLALR